jgi:hypothetical protein
MPSLSEVGATTNATYPDLAWGVNFRMGSVYNDFKVNDISVRAVRTGL